MIRVTFTRHALDRYVERVKPAFDTDAARVDIERLIDLCGAIVTDAPDWCGYSLSAMEAGLDQLVDNVTAWLLLGPDIAFAVRPAERGNVWVAFTCIVRGGRSDLARRRRREHRQLILPKQMRKSETRRRRPPHRRDDWRAAA